MRNAVAEVAFTTLPARCLRQSRFTVLGGRGMDVHAVKVMHSGQGCWDEMNECNL